MARVKPRRRLLAAPAWLAAACAAAGLAGPPVAAAPPASMPAVLQACRLPGVAQPALCGQLRRPLDPGQPQGSQIELHFAVLPALARHKAADPVFFFAGGPGQSAIDLAGAFSGRFARLQQRRDLVLVDQRGTGRSAPLRCDDDRAQARRRPLAEQADATARLARLQACRLALQALPHGDLRFYTTDIAVADVDAVRQALGAAQINAIGVSYGSRVVLALMRLQPASVRRAVLDGVVPPDMRLPEAAARDQQAVLDAVFQACAADPACQRRHPAPAAQLQRLLDRLPIRLSLPQPVSGRPEPLTLDRDTLLGLLRAPLYQPALAAALPAVLAEADAGRWAPLLALANPLGGAAASNIATGQHHAVVCNEDLALQAPGAGPAAAASGATPAAGPAAAPTVFGDSLARQYRQACAGWPRASVDPAFYRLPPAIAPIWLLSGGLDPVTPPHHAARVARALGPLAHHTVVANAGHGVTALGCLADAVTRFIIDDGVAKLPGAADCALAVPRPGIWQPPGLGASP